jgi:hypothetical protein
MIRNQETLDELITLLENNCGDIHAAARTLSVPLRFITQWRKDDPDTDILIREAIQHGTHGLVSEATRRAVHGVPRPIYYKGRIVDTQTEYSDTLLTTLLKARVTEFKPPDASALPQLTVNIANLMPRASTYEEWLSMKQSSRTPALGAETREGAATPALIDVTPTPGVLPDIL